MTAYGCDELDCAATLCGPDACAFCEGKPRPAKVRDWIPFWIIGVGFLVAAGLAVWWMVERGM
jgi:hypothetical protein